jgi:hypothetical protein
MTVRMTQHHGAPDLEQWLADVDPAFLNCRRFGHAWVEWRYQSRPEPGVMSRTILRCTRCRQKAHDDLDYSGYNTRSIQYEDGYLAPAGMGVLTSADRAKLRLETERRRVDEVGAMEEGTVRTIGAQRRKKIA